MIACPLHVEHDDSEWLWPGRGDWSPEAYEAWVGGLAGISTEGWSSRRWAAAYRRVSEAIVDRPGSVGRTTGSMDDPEGVAIRALVFGQRTALVLGELMEEGWARGRRVVDAGSGTGPGALAALAAGARSVVSVEPGPAEARWLEGARAKSPGGDRWTVARRALDPRSLDPGLGEVWVFGHSFMEMTRGRRAEARAAVGRLVEAGARVVILEAGTAAAARHLSDVRDGRPADVQRPCRGALTCPRGPGAEAWCHFTWKRRLGPAATRILQSAGRRSNLVHFSYLDLVRGGSRPTDRRLIEIQRRGRRSRVLHVCGPNGEDRLEVAPKPTEVWSWAEALVEGDLLSAPEGLPAPTDGRPVRLRAPLRALGSPRST